MALRERLIKETVAGPGAGNGNGQAANGQHSFQEMKSRLHRALINRMDLTKLAALNPALEPLYKKLADEIRKVDTHHILFLGGAQWDGNFSVFGKPFDTNVAYTFHKYWTAPDESVIRQYLDFRERFDVPIWMGESGENTDEWIAQFVKTLEKNNIGWAFWPYKRMGKPSVVVNILPPADWGKIVEFAKLPRGTGHVEERLKARPEQETITRAFTQLLESVRLERCRVNYGYLKALGMKADVEAVSATGPAR